MSGMMDWAGHRESETTPETAQETPAQRSLELGQGELLSQGRDNPEKITQLQEMLNAGGGQLEVDGVFGPRTAEAVRNFQREHNLKVDGIVGPQTMAALNGGGANSRTAQTPPGGAGENDRSGAGETNGAGASDTNRTATDANGATETRPNGPNANSTTRLEGLPERAEDAMGGRAFMDSISHLPPGRQRDQAILNEILSGNIPDASRNLQEMVINRNGREIRLNAMSDYLAVGSNEDNIRVPMTPAVAQAIADRTGTSLPTDRLVDDIHSQSRQLNMAPMSNNREGIGTYIAHDQRIDDQLGSGQAPDGFVSGHKKDLVIPHRDGRVAIYGGRWANGERIQSYSNVHHDGYEDYSHGARLVSQQITVDGQSMRLEDALADPALRSLFTNQSGAFRY
ncbi:MAG: peptidoglycan-binding protein [Candidatus Eremiobacteraeota bacterium]|nr:peptidoglycan-binding protein [Candidatus Eremiobacteraeota bacterium]